MSIVREIDNKSRTYYFYDDMINIKILDQNKIKIDKWDKVFKNGPSKICGRQPLKNLKEYGLPEACHTPSNFLKVAIRKFYLVHS